MTRTLRAGLAAALILSLSILGAQGAAASGGQNPGANAPNPLVGQTWWDQNTEWNDTWNGYRSLKRRGRDGDAAKVLLLAETPQFKWFGMWEQPVVGKLQGMFEQAGDSVPLLAVFGDEHAGCGSPGTNTSGGLAQNARYKRWIDQVARGIGDNEVVIAFEPDSLGLIECLQPSLRAPRLRTLGYGVKALSKLPNATVYVEAGAPDWQDVPTMARKLRALGVSRVRGFMLNATHHVTTAEEPEVRGEALARRGGQALHRQHLPQRQRPAVPRRSHDLVQPAERRRRCSCRPPTPGIRRPTPTCGSSGPATRTAPATAARRESGPGGRSARSRWSSARSGGAAGVDVTAA